MSFFNDVERELVLVDRIPVAEGVVSLVLESSNGRPLPAWTPGAHIDLTVGPGVERQYSLCGDPQDRSRWRVSVLHEPEGRGGSTAAHQLEIGRPVRSRGPRSHFAFEPEPGRPVTFVAGGIGITPLLSMVDQAAADGRDWQLHYSGRRRQRMAFADDLLARFGPEHVHLHVSELGDRLDVDGLVRDRGAGEIWACGPAGLLDALTTAAEREPATVVHTERFVPLELTAPVWVGDFEVELAQTGDVVVVPPELSVLEALEAHGALTVSSCREGTCGTCETVVIEGEVDHRDSVLTAAEQGENMSMMTCVSRAACPRLVLDL